MYCSNCGAAVAKGLIFCNQCGARLGGPKEFDAASVVTPSEVKPELLVSAMVAGLILGLVAIAVLIGVLKAVAGFDLPFLLIFTMLSFLLLLAVEGVLVRLLFKSRRVPKATADAARPEERTTRGLGEPQAHSLQEPAPFASVTEQTTRTLESSYGERQTG
jgi:predicted lipid-binding transport protein (Tim44 family)